MDKKKVGLCLLIISLLLQGCGNRQNVFEGSKISSQTVEEKAEKQNRLDGNHKFLGKDIEDDNERPTEETTNEEQEISGNTDLGEEKQNVVSTEKTNINQDDIENVDAENDLAFLGKYVSFEEYKERGTGSVGLIGDKTILVSVYLEEPDYTWEESELEYTQEVMRIGYTYLEEQFANYGVKLNLLYDVQKYPDLQYSVSLSENIPIYVTTEQERQIDDLEDLWIETIPYQELMDKYQADSIGFLFFVAHEGCSYSSMHFLADGPKTWDESCLLYLKDMYSDTLEYETPAVYAHELLHLFGAEDLYKDAKVFSKETYQKVNEMYPDDIMIDTFKMINGKYTIYPDKVVQEISPLTAYLAGVTSQSDIVKEFPELEKEEMGCFSGSTYDRPF